MIIPDQIKSIERVHRDVFFTIEGDAYHYSLCSCPTEELAELVMFCVDTYRNLVRDE